MVDKGAVNTELDRICEEVKKLACEHKEWRIKKDEPNFKIFKSESPHFGGKVYKVESTLDFSPEALFNFAYPLNYGWNPHVEKVDLLEELSDNSLLLHMYMKPSFEAILKGRDAIQAIRMIDHGDKKCICQGSVEVAQHPPKDGHVRAFNYPSGMVLEKIDGEPNKTKCVSIIQADIKANVPPAILSKAFYHLIEEHHKALIKCDIAGAESNNGKPGRK